MNLQIDPVRPPVHTIGVIEIFVVESIHNYHLPIMEQKIIICDCCYEKSLKNAWTFRFVALSKFLKEPIKIVD